MLTLSWACSVSQSTSSTLTWAGFLPASRCNSCHSCSPKQWLSTLCRTTGTAANQPKFQKKKCKKKRSSGKWHVMYVKQQSTGSIVNCNSGVTRGAAFDPIAKLTHLKFVLCTTPRLELKRRRFVGELHLRGPNPGAPERVVHVDLDEFARIVPRILGDGLWKWYWHDRRLRRGIHIIGTYSFRTTTGFGQL